MNSLIIVSCKIEFQLHGIVIAEKKRKFYVKRLAHKKF